MSQHIEAHSFALCLCFLERSKSIIKANRVKITLTLTIENICDFLLHKKRTGFSLRCVILRSGN